jgi:hypothetical protein
MLVSLGLVTLGCGSEAPKKPAAKPETKPGASAPSTPATPPAAPEKDKK